MFTDSSIFPTVAESVGVDVNGAHSAGYVAQGAALAASFIKDEKDRADWLNRYVSQLSELDTTGRAEFRKVLNAHVKGVQEHVKQWAKGTPEHDRYARIARSAVVRLSEMTTISRAMDAGMSPEYATNADGTIKRDSRGVASMLHPFHTTVTDARLFLNTNAAGPTQKKGRPAVGGFIKAMRYAAKAEAIDDKDAALLAKLHEFAAQLALEAGVVMEEMKGEDAPV